MPLILISYKKQYPFIFLAILSIIAYFYAPNKYSIGYNYYCFCHFIFSIILFFRTKKKKNYFDFETFFIISYFITFYIYPVFLYPINPKYFSFIVYAFDENLISKGSGLVLIGSQMFILGSLSFVPPLMEKNKPIEYIPDKVFIAITICLFLLFIFSGGFEYYTNLYSGKADARSDANTLFAYANQLSNIFLIISVVLEFCKHLYYNQNEITFKKLNPVLLLFIIIYILFLLSIGVRGGVIQIALIIMGLYALYYKPIKFKKLILLVLIGASAMYIIAATRGEREFQINGFVDIFSDLIGVNNNLYVAIEYVNNNGYSLGVSMLGYILKVIPFAQQIIFSLFDINANYTSSAMIMSIETLGENPEWGVGTNIIADIYIAFGVVGVIIFMFYGGYITSKAHYYAQRHNLYYIFLYAIFLSMSVYIVRAEYFYCLNVILWIFVIINISINGRKHIFKK